LLWTGQARPARLEGTGMAEDESFLTNPPTQDVAIHVRDYTRFTKLFKYGAAICFVLAMFVLLIL
jgi:hypothetical protein